MNGHTTILAIVGGGIALCAACAAIFWALARAGAVVDQMRREEAEAWSDDDSEWLGVTHYEQPSAIKAPAPAPGNISEISAKVAQ